MPNPGYATIGIYKPGETRPSLMTANGRVIVFDTPEMATQFLPLLGGGRQTCWQADGETAFWMPMQPGGVNRACVIRGYDPYDLPVGLPVRSETRGKAWRDHVYWVHWWTDCGQMAQAADGTWHNTALGEAR